MTEFLKLTRAGLISFARDRTALFFSLFFPLVFMVLFGSIFQGDKGGPSLKLDVGVVVNDPSPTVSWIADAFRKAVVFNVHTGSEAEERGQLANGKRNAVVVFPADFSAHMTSGETTPVQILFDPANAQSAQLTTGILHQFLDGIDRHMTGRAPLLEAQDAPMVRTSAAGKLRGVDYLVPGILAMTVMQLGMFTAIPIVNMREKGILKRFRATPLPRSILVLSQIAVRLIIAVVQTGILLGIASAMFHFRIMGSWLEVLGVTVLGALTFISIGAVVAGIAKTQESAAPLIQMFNLPMMFLSGMFFTTDVLPPFLKPVTNAIPATYLADGMRAVAIKSTSGHSLGMCVAVMGAWLVCSLVVAMRTFRWE